MKVGFGYDVHRLADGYDLWIGGIKIPHSKGSVGHSDADVLIHAICDSLLGAANLGDIGIHFPDNNPDFKGIDSKILLKKVLAIITAKKYIIINIDSTICLQNPKISTWIPAMKKTLADVLEIGEDCISIKATTTEKMGFVGREEGIEAYAVTLLEINV
jgi:2-C-methyl-D-erythritol 2,4-cyclodiphosphate synthase